MHRRDSIALSAEEFLHQFAQALIVINHQDRARSIVHAA
jgi:hypothetical protein